MRVVCTVISTLAVILNYIELGSQFDCLPNGDPIPAARQRRPPPSSPSSERHSPVRSLLTNEPHPSVGSSTRAVSSFRARSRSQPSRPTFPKVFGFDIGELGLIRLISLRNPSRVFQLRKYIFPADKRIQMRTSHNTLRPIPDEEQIVLSTLDGEVFAVMEKAQNRQTIFRGIYKPHLVVHAMVSERAKININSGVVESMTAGEIEECPVGYKNPIAKSFIVRRV